MTDAEHIEIFKDDDDQTETIFVDIHESLRSLSKVDVEFAFVDRKDLDVLLRSTRR